MTLIEAVLGFTRTDGFDVEYRPGHDWMCDYEQSHPEAECLWRWPDPLGAFVGGLGASDAVDRYSPRRLMGAARSERGAGKVFVAMMADAVDAIADAGRATA